MSFFPVDPTPKMPPPSVLMVENPYHSCVQVGSFYRGRNCSKYNFNKVTENSLIDLLDLSDLMTLEEYSFLFRN